MSTLCSFLGLVNFFSRFMSDGSSLLHPLNQLFKCEVKLVWSDDCVRAILNAIFGVSDPRPGHDSFWCQYSIDSWIRSRYWCCSLPCLPWLVCFTYHSCILCSNICRGSLQQIKREALAIVLQRAVFTSIFLVNVLRYGQTTNRSSRASVNTNLSARPLWQGFIGGWSLASIGLYMFDQDCKKVID